MIRILIAEDSGVVAMLLKAIFEQEPDLEVVGHAKDGREAVTLADELRPDLVTMDIRMPRMDGFEATREIMSNAPIPIVVISSSVDDEELRITFRAIEEGALAVIEKPRGIGHPDFDAIRRDLVQTVRAMAEVKLVRRRRHPVQHPQHAAPAAATPPSNDCRIIGIGASTGGPQALRHLLAGLPANVPIPIVAVQHIGSGFIGGLVEWLQGYSEPTVRLAHHGEPLRAGTVYFAPEDRHLCVEQRNGEFVAVLCDSEPVHGSRPSVDPLFQSLARCCGRGAVGILLSGMGEDGADGLLQMRQAGARTYCQDRESCVVFGMPGAAMARDAVQEALGLDALCHRMALCGS